MESVNDKNAVIKAPKTTKAQIIGVSIFAVCIVLVVTALIVVFVLNFNKTYPSQVKFFENGDKIYCQAEVNDNFEGYRFKFEDDQASLEFDSKDALIEVSSLQGIEVGKTYKVSVCYLGELEGGNSEYSKPFSWTCYTYLGTPSNINILENSIDWQDVENADYYYVYYRTDKVDYVKCTTSQISFDELPAGVLDLTIVARSDKNYLKPSLTPAQKQVTITKVLSPFTRVSFNSTSNMLSIRGLDRVEMIEVLVNGHSYFASNFTTQGSGAGYLFTIDLSAVIGNGGTVSARPYSENPYIIYNGDFVEAA